jgi:hypothetical protein
MTEAPMFSMSNGRARSSFPVNCHLDGWLGGQDVSVIGATVVGATVAGAMGYSPKTTAKRNTPGNLAGGLT